MLILILRTDNPTAEIGLFDDHQQLAVQTWQAHRLLGATIHTKIQELLEDHGKEWSDIQGIVAYEGPGSFTGLRIGLSVANALIASYQLPAIGATGDNWLQNGIEQLLQGKGQTKPVLPEYGAPIFTTPPKK